MLLLILSYMLINRVKCYAPFEQLITYHKVFLLYSSVIYSRGSSSGQKYLQVVEVFVNLLSAAWAWEHHNSAADYVIKLMECGGLCHQAEYVHSQVVVFGSTVEKKEIHTWS